MKKSIYSNPKYCLSWHGDTVFLSIEVEILKTGEESYKANILKAQFDPVEEAFPVWLVSHMASTTLDVIINKLKDRLMEELTPSLFTLFYVGELQPDATDITS